MSKYYYQCPMHPEVLSESPGKCPQCHMALEKSKPSKHGNHSNHDHHVGHSSNAFRQKFWISLVLTIPTLLFSPTIQGWLGFDLTFAGSHYIPAIFGLIIFFYGGVVFLKSARGELAARQPGMMTLISMAILVAFSYSLAVTLGLLDGMDFWWELATLITIMLLGHWLEMASVENAQGSLQELAKLLPDEAELVTKNGTKKVATSELKVGDKILIRPGGQIPADGEVIKGSSEVDESMLTGESKPVKKAIGTSVIGGTINSSGSLTVRITQLGDDTALAGIMKLVEEAQSNQSKTQILADKAASYLTYIAIAAAIITWLAWALAGESTNFILERVVTVLIIACPHALGLAIPLVVAISTARAAKNGLLVRQRLALESARNIDVVLFDKTGTLTKGEQGVIGVFADNEADLLRLAGSIEQDSEHPIAKAIVKKAQDEAVKISEVSNFSALKGRGVKANIDGRAIYVGGPRLVEERQVKLTSELKNAAKQASKNGQAIIYVIEGKSILGALTLADVIREESRAAIADLKASGKRVAMLTGDSEGVASWVARELGIDEYFAEVLPEHKADIVKQLQADGSTVAMVGDGVNDAPALAQADIGVAIGAGTDVAIESADIVLVSNNPESVAKLINLSKATYRKMIQNLWWAAGYNILAIPLATGLTVPLGFVLNPAVGAVLMSLSTIIVAANAQLLRKTRRNH